MYVFGPINITDTYGDNGNSYIETFWTPEANVQ